MVSANSKVKVVLKETEAEQLRHLLVNYVTYRIKGALCKLASVSFSCVSH